MLDSCQAHVTDFGQANPDEMDGIMTKIRDMSPTGRRAGPVSVGVAGALGQDGSIRLRKRNHLAIHQESPVASIEAVLARQILDSRGNPTLEAEVIA